MAMSESELLNCLRSAFPDAKVRLTPLANDGDHYAAEIKSAAFSGKTRVQQHQMVYQALQGRMGNSLHALALHTAPPDVNHTDVNHTDVNHTDVNHTDVNHTDTNQC